MKTNFGWTQLKTENPSQNPGRKVWASGNIYSTLMPVALKKGCRISMNYFEFEMIRFCVVRRKLKIRLVNFVGMFIKPIPSKTKQN